MPDSPKTIGKSTFKLHPVISIDAMGGDRGPAAVVGGMVKAARMHPDVMFVVHGKDKQLQQLLGRKPLLSGKYRIQHAPDTITMKEKPTHALRNGKGSSMWSAVDSVRDGVSHAAVSCGNTGALMAISMLKLKVDNGHNRPAIACLWPSRNPRGFNILLDAGADVRANVDDLVGYAFMGCDYARDGLGLKRPRIGLLNVGKEEHKGRKEIRDAHEIIASKADEKGYTFVGFVEGSDIPSNLVDVIVTDGFTGNITLKSVEGTADLIREFLQQAFRHSPLSRIGTMLVFTSLRRFWKKIDPRHGNGGVFLGLKGIIVKSHGSADAVAVSAAIDLAVRLVRARLAKRRNSPTRDLLLTKPEESVA